MSGIIQLLPEKVANQIAAGEVVQRPSSVVKELIENSIDSGATDIQLIVKDAGKTLIQLVDNGKGMSYADAKLCFERHATSKIKKSDDLFKIRTFGFRGEAMASIAAVAQVEMKSRQTDEDTGVKVVIEGSEIKTHEEEACPVGTSIMVRNLFYNVPARRNFLKSNPVELKHIIEEFQRAALSHPEVGFTLFQNDLETHKLKPGNLGKRIVGLFGKQYKEQLMACEEEAGEIKITGYLGKPEMAKKTRGEQFFFVNDRFIKHNYLNHAVLNGYEGLLPQDTHPFFTLFIEIDPKHVDVNVHPTKTEVKFDDERGLYAIIKSAVKKSLGVFNVSPSIDFDANINFSYTGDDISEVRREHDQGFKDEMRQTRRESSNKENWEELFKGFEKPVEQNRPDTSGESFNVSSDLKDQPGEHNADVLFQIHNQYIVAQVKSGMMLVDQQAAHERVHYEKYAEQLENKFGASQQFLFPQTLNLSASDYSLVMEIEEEIRSLGFVFNDFGNNTIVINGIPSDIPSGSEKGLFENLLEQFKFNESKLKLDRSENLARSLAKRSAVKAGTRLSSEEMKSLIDQLFACQNPNYAPGGNLTYIILDFNNIESYFNK